MGLQRVSRAAFLLDALQENLCPCLFQLLEFAGTSWLWPLPPFQSQQCHIFKSLPSLIFVSTVTSHSLNQTLLHSSYKDPCDYLAPSPPGNSGSPPHTKILNFACKVTSSQASPVNGTHDQGLGHGYFWGGILSPPLQPQTRSDPNVQTVE